MTETVMQMKTIAIRELINRYVTDWNQQVEAARAYRAENAPRIAESLDKIEELHVCAQAVVNVKSPFSFKKRYSHAFLEGNKDVSIWARGNNFEGDRAGAHGYDFQRGTGSLDYWAAATVDPEFMSLCQQAILLHDNKDDMKRSELLVELHGVVKPDEVRYAWDDKFRGLISAAARGKLGVMTPASLRVMGANSRLKDMMKERFEALMVNPETAARINNMRDHFINTHAGYIENRDAERSKIKSIRKADPMATSLQVDVIRRLLYLEMQRQNKITFSDDTGIEAVIIWTAQRMNYEKGERQPLAALLDNRLKRLDLAEIESADSYYSDESKFTNMHSPRLSHLQGGDVLPEIAKETTRDLIGKLRAQAGVRVFALA